MANSALKQPGFFRKFLLSFTPFPIILDEFIEKFNSEENNGYLFLEEPELPEDFKEHFFPEERFFYRDRRRIRSGLIVIQDDKHSPASLYRSFMEWYGLHDDASKIFRFIPCRNSELLPHASYIPAFLVLWFAESTPLEKLLGKKYDLNVQLLDQAARKAKEFINKKPWRRWRNFRYMCSGNDSDEGITKTQLYITKSKFRAVMISLPDSTGESIPVFFDRMSGAKNINLEHKQVISASNHSGMKSLSVELKKNGRYSFAANHAVVLQYSVSLSKWISLENQSDDASEITSCKGKLQKGDRLILSAGTHVDEMNLLLDEISKSKDEWTQSVSGGASRGRSIFIMRD